MAFSGMKPQLGQFIKPMIARPTQEVHRAATPLELLFDLVSVIAIAAAAAGLHHSVVENHIGSGLIAFIMAFFSIWWAWMNFTWFASAYDNDDTIYRVAVFIMLTGSLVLAAGISDIFTIRDFTLGIAGYVIMRLAHVGLLLRASIHNPQSRTSSRFFALGIVLCQAGWIIGFDLVSPAYVPIVFALMVAIEFSIPAVISKYGTIPWHVGHIAERYGLLTIIVLGESLLSLIPAIQKISKFPDNTLELTIHTVSGLIAMFAAWWLYFGEKEFRALEKKSSTFLWGYGHVIIFASIAAFGAGLAIKLDYLDHHAKIGELIANASVTLPAAGYIFGIWFVHERYNLSGIDLLIFPTIAIAMLASSYLSLAVPAIAVLMILAAAMRARLTNA